MKNLSESKCTDNGDYINNACSCDWGWFGETCDLNGIELWSNTGWEAFKILFTILYILLFVVSLIKLNITLNKDKIIGFKRLFYRLFRSPKNLSLLYLVLIGILRSIWLIYDPFRLSNRLSRIQERLLFEIVYPLIYGLYASILLVWGGLYQGMQSKSSDPCKIVRKLIMFMMIAAFPVSLIISVLKGYRLPNVWYPFALSFVLFGTFLIVVGFTVYGILLCVYVEKNTSYENNILPRRISVFETTPRNTHKSRGSANGMDSIHEIKTARISKDWYHLHFHECSWQEFPSDEMPNYNEKQFEIFKFKELPIEYKMEKKHEDGTVISLITIEDQTIFRKLWILFSVSLSFGILVLVFFPIYSSFKTKPNPNNELLVLYIVLSLELFGCFLLYLVFTTQIKVKDKSYLRFFTSMSLKMNNHIPKMKYPKIFETIGQRLHNFYL